MKASPASSLPKGKKGFDLFYGSTSLEGAEGVSVHLGPQRRSRAREDFICSSLVPQRRSRAKRTYLFYLWCLTSLEGEDDLSVLWPIILIN